MRVRKRKRERGSGSVAGSSDSKVAMQCPRCGSRELLTDDLHTGDVVDRNDGAGAYCDPCGWGDLALMGSMRYLREGASYQCRCCSHVWEEATLSPEIPTGGVISLVSKKMTPGKKTEGHLSAGCRIRKQPGFEMPSNGPGLLCVRNFFRPRALPWDAMLRFAVAALCAAAITTTQIRHGGIFTEYLSLPGFVLISLAAMLGLPLAFRQEGGWRPSLPALFLALASAAWIGGLLVFSQDACHAGIVGRHLLAGACLYFLFSGILAPTRYALAFWGFILVGNLSLLFAVLWQVARGEGGPVAGWMSSEVARMYESRFFHGLPTRASAFFVNGNQLAWALNAGTIISISLASFGSFRPWRRFLLLYFGMASLVGTLLTMSRGGFLGLLAAAISLFVLGSIAAFVTGDSTRKKRVAVGVCSLGLCLFAGGATVVFLPVLRERLDSIFADPFRTSLWESALRAVSSAPLTGSGPASFGWNIRRFLPGWPGTDPIFAHNDWLQVCAEYGMPALQLVAACVVAHLLVGCSALLWQLSRRARVFEPREFSTGFALRLGLVCWLVSCCIHSFFDFNMEVPSNAWLAVASLGALAARAPGRSRFRRPVLLPSRGVRVAIVAAGALCGLGLLCSSLSEADAILEREGLHRDIAAGHFGNAGERASRSALRFDGNPAIQQLAGEATVRSAAENQDPEARRREVGFAVERLGRACKLEPGDAWHHLWRGIALDQAGRQNEAERALLVAAALAPGYVEIQEQLGRHYELACKPEQAIEIYSKIAAQAGSAFAAERLKALRPVVNPVK